MSRPRRPIAQAVLAGCIPEPNSGCWLWLGKPQKNGYCRVYGDGNTSWAHRASYRAFVGEIPRHLEIDHLCRVRSCVNPRHLEAVPHRVNMQRGAAYRIATNVSCRKGHPLVGWNLMSRGKRRRCRECHNKQSRDWFRRRAGLFVATDLKVANVRRK